MKKLIAHVHYLPERGGYRLLLYSLLPEHSPEQEDAPIKWVTVRYGASHAEASAWYAAQTGSAVPVLDEGKYVHQQVLSR